ncbi:MAG: hypothetical protein HQ514_06105 [Rhodospirillales bacterium]|nr:hypothetical protein [Rhodospirillales bacterium]
MTKNPNRDGRDVRNIADSRRGPSGARGSRVMTMVGTRAVSQVRLHPKLLSWRLARNPLFHASVAVAAES